MIYIELILVSLITIFMLFYSGFVEYVKHKIFQFIYGKNIKYINFNIKPFDCELCMLFWVNLIYTITAGELTIYTLFFICILSALNTHLYNFFYILNDIISFISNKILNIFNKN